MKFTLRDYQQAASDAALRFFRSRSQNNGILVLPTGAGKSLVIADIAHRLGGNILVFQPSKEILEQNFNKLKIMEKKIVRFILHLSIQKKSAG